VVEVQRDFLVADSRHARRQPIAQLHLCATGARTAACQDCTREWRVLLCLSLPAPARQASLPAVCPHPR
jgi:hypothetical protein